jgi:hypothetical protein
VTDRIDLDEYGTESDEQTDTDAKNRGDWFWKETDDPTTRPAQESAENGTHETSIETSDSTDTAIPRVPRENDDKPVGIPVKQGGAGGVSVDKQGQDRSATETVTSETSGPHGGGVDDMTLAFTYEAAKRLTEPQRAFADAGRWADWIGIIGYTDAHVLNTFQRRNHLDLDFFNGTGTGPGERLAEIDEHSMFFAERMVVVGSESESKEIAETADWEFVPLSEAAAKAEWKLK